MLLAGGELREGSALLATSGPATVSYLESKHTDWAIVEGEGIHPYAGLTTSMPWQVATDRALLTAGTRRCVVAANGAFGRRYVGFIADVGSVDIIVTDGASPTRGCPPLPARWCAPPPTSPGTSTRARPAEATPRHT